MEIIATSILVLVPCWDFVIVFVILQRLNWNIGLHQMAKHQNKLQDQASSGPEGWRIHSENKFHQNSSWSYLIERNTFVNGVFQKVY